MRTKVKLISDNPHEYLTLDSVVDGPGIRATIWFQGCNHNCKSCHNPSTHSFIAGKDVYIDDIKKEIYQLSELNFYDGITFSGGDPLYQIDALYELTKYAKELGFNIWVYTGFIFENIPHKEKLKYIDVLVDGPFILEQKSFNDKYKGSLNQRLVDIQKSLKTNGTVLYI